MTGINQPVAVAGSDPGHADVLAAGAVMWRPTVAGVEVALVHRPSYDDWSFPKGKLEPGESMPFAAVREVAEETGGRIRLGALLGDIRYEVSGSRKLVRYWSAQLRDGEFVANKETDELRWLDPAAAAKLLTYRHDIELVGLFATLGPATSTVLLVRHAKAGSRNQWDGDDDLRPLSGTGREQAAHVSRLLELFGPDRLLSAPPVRCRDTIASLADALGLPIGEEVLLGEQGYWKDPAAGLARLRELAAEPGVTVISSQGGVVPDVMSTLMTQLPGRDPDDVACRKASIWVLTFTGRTLRAADHYPRPTD